MTQLRDQNESTVLGSFSWYTFGESLKGDSLKHPAVALLFLCSALVWAVPSATDYGVNVQVSATRMVRYGDSAAHYQLLSVVIDGQKYELESVGMPNALLMLGDYKARLLKNQHWAGTYDSWRVYEVLLPDNKKRQSLVVGQSE